MGVDEADSVARDQALGKPRLALAMLAPSTPARAGRQARKVDLKSSCTSIIAVW
jgi:hypothetical protein